MNSHPSPEQRDDRLAVLLEELTLRIRLGQPVDLAAVIAREPELAVDLRELWAAVLVAEGVAQAHDSQRTLSSDDRQPAPEVRPPAFPRVFGDYELLDELGRGGMGVVFRARQIGLERIVALKMMLKGGMATSADRARFVGEAEAAARLEHPHVVPVYEVGQHEGEPYFSMRLISGTTLARRLADGPLPPREAAALLAPICRALDYAHRQGLVHRDVKPSNILIDEHARPHVSDFGLAKRIAVGESLTRSGAILGTPSYMSPEQATGGRGEVGPASDVYSLGAVLYQTLTGRPPFMAASAVDTVLQVLEQDPIPPQVLNPTADRELAMIALKCLQKPADLRYSSAASLADDIEAYLAGNPVSARSGGFGDVVARWFRETHHAPILENWGLLWILHSLVLMCLCVATSLIFRAGYRQPWPYFGLWNVGLGTWAAIFWYLRRRGGPVTFVERQIAHVWAASVISTALVFFVEMALGLPVLTLSPLMAITSGSVFIVKAGMLSGSFYAQAAALFATSLLMAGLTRFGRTDLAIVLFGLAGAACFFIPGWKYHRQQARGRQRPVTHSAGPADPHG